MGMCKANKTSPSQAAFGHGVLSQPTERKTGQRVNIKTRISAACHNVLNENCISHNNTSIPQTLNRKYPLHKGLPKADKEHWGHRASRLKVFQSLYFWEHLCERRNKSFILSYFSQLAHVSYKCVKKKKSAFHSHLSNQAIWDLNNVQTHRSLQEVSLEYVKRCFSPSTLCQCQPSSIKILCADR